MKQLYFNNEHAEYTTSLQLQLVLS